MNTLNFHKIGKWQPYPAVIKLLAREFIEGASYFTVGKWFQDLSQYDLDMLLEMAEAFEERGLHGEPIMVLTEMLTAAEGVQNLDAEGAQKRVAYLISLLIIESLHRKDQLEVDHNGFSFGDDEMDRSIAWKKGTPRPEDPKPNKGKKK